MNCQRWNCMRKCVDQDPQYPAGIGNLSRETGVAFARLYVRGVETAIAFAVEKWAFLVQLSGAEVPSVSRWPYQRLQRCHWFHSRHVAVSCARKSSPCVLRKAHDRRFMAYWASYFAKMPLEGLRWANVVAPLALLACHATIRGSGQARRPQPGRSRSRVIAPNEPPALASCGGGRQYEESSSDKQRNRCKRR